jgi:hypothetical protein
LRGIPQQALPTQVFVGSGTFQKHEDYDWVPNTLSSMSRTCNSLPVIIDKNFDVISRVYIQRKDEESRFNETAVKNRPS